MAGLSLLIIMAVSMISTVNVAMVQLFNRGVTQLKHFDFKG